MCRGQIAPDFRGESIYATSQPNQYCTGGSWHETFKVDRYGNVFKGHTSVDLGKGQKVHIPWERLTAKILK